MGQKGSSFLQSKKKKEGEMRSTGGDNEQAGSMKEWKLPVPFIPWWTLQQ